MQGDSAASQVWGWEQEARWGFMGNRQWEAGSHRGSMVQGQGLLHEFTYGGGGEAVWEAGSPCNCEGQYYGIAG